MLLKLKDGRIERFKDDSYHYGGCPTCDYGSEYITEVDITLTKYKIHIETNQMYNYALSVGDMMRILLGNVDEIREMTEQEFTVWLEGAIKDQIGIGEYNLNGLILDGLQFDYKVKEESYNEEDEED